MEPSSSTTSRERALSMSNLLESDRSMKKAKHTNLDANSVGDTGRSEPSLLRSNKYHSQFPNMPATAAHINAVSKILTTSLCLHLVRPQLASQ